MGSPGPGSRVGSPTTTVGMLGKSRSGGLHAGGRPRLYLRRPLPSALTAVIV